MSERLEISWATGEPCVLDCAPVSYEIAREVLINGKRVIERTKLEFQVCTATKATAEQLEAWQKA